MNSRRISLLTALLALLATGFSLRAQELVLPEGYSAVDSVYKAPAPVLDSLNLGRNIFHAMPPGVRINQSTAVQSAFHQTMRANPNRKISGYRIRIFLTTARAPAAPPRPLQPVSGACIRASASTAPMTVPSSR